MSNFFPISLKHIVADARAKQKNRHHLKTLTRQPELALLRPGGDPSPLRYPFNDDTSLADPIDAAVSRGTEYALSQQDAQGYWWEVLDTNTTLTSEYIMTSHFMGLVDPQSQHEASNYLLEQQQDDGGWSLYQGGPSDLSTSIEAYFGLKLAGHSPSEPQLKKAREFILSKGGLLNCRIFTKINLALFGQFPWSGCPAMPPQLMLLPKGFAFNIYEFSCWSRVVIVPLTIIMHKKPIVPIPRSAWVEELYAEPLGQRKYNIEASGNILSLESLFIHLDKSMKVLEKLHIKLPLAKTAMKKAERWILDHQDDSGDWGGILPAMMNSVMALKCLGYSNSHPAIRKGWEAVIRFQDRQGGILHQQSCISPVWDTAWYAIALAKSGVASDHPALQKAARWLMEKQIFRDGDWKIKNRDAQPGGWCFEFYNDFYPDTDDTMAALTALLLTDLPEKDRVHNSFARGFAWLLSMQNPDGGWSAFEREINRKILNDIPFADLKSLLDPSTCDITGRVLEFLGILGYNRNSRIVRKVIRFLKQNQHHSGGWWGRWGVNYIYGTWCALVGLKEVGEDMNLEYVQRAASWLKSIQNPDGGWGESCKSYEDENHIGKGISTPSQTAWALMGLMAAGECRSLAIRRGIQYLLSQQGEDGCWIEEAFTGTGFPKHFYLGYRGYKNYFSLLALSHYKALIA